VITPDARWQREGPALVDRLARALLLDLCAWLGAWPGPVPAEVPYGAPAIRGVEGGHARLARYLPPELLRRWDAALSPLVAGGQSVDMHLGSLTSSRPFPTVATSTSATSQKAPAAAGGWRFGSTATAG
jgi:hypothetical protein